jgi:hypothetical protein
MSEVREGRPGFLHQRPALSHGGASYGGEAPLSELSREDVAHITNDAPNSRQQKPDEEDPKGRNKEPFCHSLHLT